MAIFTVRRLPIHPPRGDDGAEISEGARGKQTTVPPPVRRATVGRPHPAAEPDGRTDGQTHQRRVASRRPAGQFEQQVGTSRIRGVRTSGHLSRKNSIDRLRTSPCQLAVNGPRYFWQRGRSASHLPAAEVSVFTS